MSGKAKQDLLDLMSKLESLDEDPEGSGNAYRGFAKRINGVSKRVGGGDPVNKRKKETKAQQRARLDKEKRSREIEILKEQSIFASEAYSEIIDFSVRSDIGEILSLFIGTFGKILEEKGEDQADSAEDARRILIQYLTRFSAVDAYIGDYF